MAYYDEQSNEFMNIVIEYLCHAFQTDYNGLADLIGCDHRWFGRYRNAEFGDKGATTTFALVELAASVSGKQIIDVLFNE